MMCVCSEGSALFHIIVTLIRRHGDISRSQENRQAFACLVLAEFVWAEI